MIWFALTLNFAIYIADPSQTVIWGDGLIQTTAGIPSTFYIQYRDTNGLNTTASAMPLMVACISDTIYPVAFCSVEHPTVLTESDPDHGYFAIEYISGTLWLEYDGWQNEDYWPNNSLPDNYYSITDNQLLIQVNGEDVPGSPFNLICYANPNVNVSNTIIIENDNVYKIGHKSVFAIIDEIKDDYDNTIMITRMNGHFSVDVSFVENTALISYYASSLIDPIIHINTILNYYFEIEFECTIPGTVTLSIYYNSESNGAEIVPIKCASSNYPSPQCIFTCYPSEVSDFIITPISSLNVTVTENIYIMIDCLDDFGYHAYLVPDYSSSVIYDINDQIILNSLFQITDDTNLLNINYEFDDAIPGRLFITINSVKSGEYHLKLKYKSIEIENSSMVINVSSGELDYDMSYVDVSQINEFMPINEDIILNIYYKDAYNNSIDYSMDNVNITATPTNKINIHKNHVSEGYYIFTLEQTVAEGGLIIINIKYNNIIIHNGLIRITIGCTSDYSIFSKVSGNGTGIISGSGDVTDNPGIAGIPLNIIVQAYDTCDRKVTTGNPDFVLDSNFTSYTEMYERIQEGDGITEFRFVITKIGMYRMNIYTHDNIIIRTSDLEIISNVLDLTNTLIIENNIIAYINEWNELNIRLRDSYDNIVYPEDALSLFNVEIAAGDANVIPIVLEDSLYKIEYNILSSSNDFIINVMYDNENVNGFPLDIFVCPEYLTHCTNNICKCDIDPSKIEVWGNNGLIETIAGEDSYIYMKIYDSDGNLFNVDVNDVKASCHSQYSEDFCYLDPSVSSNGNGEYTIYYKSGHLWQEYSGWAIDGLWPNALPDDYFFKTQNYIIIKIYDINILDTKYYPICKPNDILNVEYSYATSVTNVFKNEGDAITFGMMDQFRDDYDNMMLNTYMSGLVSIQASVEPDYDLYSSILNNDTVLKPYVTTEKVLNWYTKFDVGCSIPGKITYSINFNNLKELKTEIIPVICDNIKKNECYFECDTSDVSDFIITIIDSDKAIINNTIQVQIDSIDKLGFYTYLIKDYSEFEIYSISDQVLSSDIFEIIDYTNFLNINYILDNRIPGRIHLNITSIDYIGHFDIILKYKGNEINQSPLKIEFLPEGPNANSCYVDIENIPDVVSVGREIEINVYIRDSRDNPTDAEIDLFQLEILPEVSGSDMTFTIHKITSTTGLYQIIINRLTVQNIEYQITITYDNQNIQNNVISIRTDCMQDYSIYSKISGNGTGIGIISGSDDVIDPGIAGIPLNIIVQAYDTCGRKVTTGNPDFVLDSNFTSYTEMYERIQEGDGITEFRFVITKIGMYRMNIYTHDNIIIRTSDLEIIGNDVNTTYSIAYGPGLEKGFINEWNDVYVILRDSYDNVVYPDDAIYYLDMDIIALDVEITNFKYIIDIGYQSEYKLLNESDCLISITYNNYLLNGFPKDITFCDIAFTNCTNNTCTCLCNSDDENCEDNESDNVKTASVLFTLLNWSIPENVLKTIFYVVCSIVGVTVLLCLFCCCGGFNTCLFGGCSSNLSTCSTETTTLISTEMKSSSSSDRSESDSSSSSEDSYDSSDRRTRCRHYKH